MTRNKRVWFRKFSKTYFVSKRNATDHKLNLLQATKCLDALKAYLEGVNAAVSFAKSLSEGTKVFGDFVNMAKNVGGFVSVVGPIGAGIGSLSSILSIAWSFTDPLKSSELIAIENLQEVTLNGFKGTWKRLDDLEFEMKIGFERIKDIIEKEVEFETYNLKHDALVYLDTAHRNLLKNPCLTEPEKGRANLNNLILKCVDFDPIDVISWLHEKIFKPSTKYRKNLATFVMTLREYENDSINVGEMMSIIVEDTLTALRFANVCTEVRHITGLKEAECKVTEILETIERLNKEKRNQLSIKIAFDGASGVYHDLLFREENHRMDYEKQERFAHTIQGFLQKKYHWMQFSVIFANGYNNEMYVQYKSDVQYGVVNHGWWMIPYETTNRNWYNAMLIYMVPVDFIIPKEFSEARKFLDDFGSRWKTNIDTNRDFADRPEKCPDYSAVFHKEFRAKFGERFWVVTTFDEQSTFAIDSTTYVMTAYARKPYRKCYSFVISAYY